MGPVHSNRQSTPVVPPLLEGEQVGRCHGSQHWVCRKCTGALAVAACDAMSCSVVQCGPVWRTRQCWATHSNTLTHTDTHYKSPLQQATHSNMLQPTVTRCKRMQHTANTLQYTAENCNTSGSTSSNVTHCSTLQHTATNCSQKQASACNPKTELLEVPLLRTTERTRKILLCVTGTCKHKDT